MTVGAQTEPEPELEVETDNRETATQTQAEQPCEPVNPEKLYVSDHGERWHTSGDCRGLRTATRVTARTPCAFCVPAVRHPSDESQNPSRAGVQGLGHTTHEPKESTVVDAQALVRRLSVGPI